MNQKFKFRAVAVAATLALPMTAAMATNGMLMEGYGPISTGMGGVSQAIEHGNAAMAQNPATLGLAADGTSSISVAVGVLGPDVTSSVPGAPEAKSGGNRYVMPALGYTKRNGAWTYGVGMFAQGGMGTEYSGNDWMGLGSGQPTRSELGVGNVLVPVTYAVNDKLTLGATVKFIWSTLDMQMNGRVVDLATMVDQNASSGPTIQALGGVAQTAMGASMIGRLSFSDNDKFTGAAKGHGFGATLGAVYQVSNTVRVGGSYQFKTALSDLETSNSAATLGVVGAPSDVGKITVINFQMPAVLAVGAGWQVSPSVLLAADIKHIAWAEVMKSFRMRFDSSVGGGTVMFDLPQNWRDQTVLNLGAAWKANERWTLRGGVSLADNPVPDQNVNFLFPAIEANHVMMGFGYQWSKKSSFDASVTFAPKVTVTNPGLPSAGVPPITISHSQTNLQLMYTYGF